MGVHSQPSDGYCEKYEEGTLKFGNDGFLYVCSYVAEIEDWAWIKF